MQQGALRVSVARVLQQYITNLSCCILNNLFVSNYGYCGGEGCKLRLVMHYLQNSFLKEGGRSDPCWCAAMFMLLYSYHKQSKHYRGMVANMLAIEFMWLHTNMGASDNLAKYPGWRKCKKSIYDRLRTCRRMITSVTILNDLNKLTQKPTHRSIIITKVLRAGGRGTWEGEAMLNRTESSRDKLKSPAIMPKDELG